MNETTWYQSLIRPEWAPPAWIFGPVWSMLYTLIAVSFGYVFYLYLKKRISFLTTLPFLLNLFFNLIFTPIQFGLQNNILAAIDIVLVLATLVWSLVVIYKHAPWVTYINLPYLAWVAFAAVLQLNITYLNF